MKTEGLTWAEAVRAYADGERIKDRGSYEYWLENEEPRCTEINGYENFAPEPADGPFSIVKPAPDTITFDEAYALLMSGKTLGVQFPDHNVLLNMPPKPLKGALFIDYTLRVLTLHVAEQRGWPITVKEDES